MMDLFCQSHVLSTVLVAISAPAKSLAMTFLGVGIVTFVYAAIGFHWFRSAFGDYCNENVLTCTQNVIYQGTRNGIVGLSSMMKQVMPEDSQTWLQRMSYDITYFIVYGVMILNTIVGLIVDSFSSLRANQTARELHLDTQTFIACLDRKRIDAVAQTLGISDGFAYHETYKQNKWDYMAFVFYLREKRLQDCTGPEQLIFDLLNEGDYKWLPLGHSLLLERADAELAGSDDALHRIEFKLDRFAQKVGTAEDWKVLTRSVADLAASVRKRLDGMQEDLGGLVQNIRTTVTGSHPVGSRGFHSPNADRVNSLVAQKQSRSSTGGDTMNGQTSIVIAA